MCGIWGALTTQSFSSLHSSRISSAFARMSHRGPDASKIIHRHLQRSTGVLHMGFHQLNFIGDASQRQVALQPAATRGGSAVYTHCNGELYNYACVARHLNLSTATFGSDCDILPACYPFQLNRLHGEYAYGVCDDHHSQTGVSLHLGTDHLALRPLFVTISPVHGIAWSSELKGLLSLFEAPSESTGTETPCRTFRVPPSSVVIAHGDSPEALAASAHLVQVETSVGVDAMHTYREGDDEEEVLHSVRSILSRCVQDMVLHSTQRQVGFLLSGGLDSSIVASIAARHAQRMGAEPIRTFSIGMPGGTDEAYARQVASHLGSVHTHVSISDQDCVSAVSEVVRATETWDVTTIRASVPQYLLAKFIRQHTDLRVLLGGDGSDEVCSGYLYSHLAPSPAHLVQDSRRLLRNIHLYDALRADRTMAAHGLEMRFPFLDKRFTDYYTSLPGALRAPSASRHMKDGAHKIEKRLLRDAFRDLLPHDVCYRTKEAFSDGIASTSSQWYSVFGDVTREAAVYRSLFDEAYPGHQDVIPGMWLPRWVQGSDPSSGTMDPSARCLDIYPAGAHVPAP